MSLYLCEATGSMTSCHAHSQSCTDFGNKEYSWLDLDPVLHSFDCDDVHVCVCVVESTLDHLAQSSPNTAASLSLSLPPSPVTGVISTVDPNVSCHD